MLRLITTTTDSLLQYIKDDPVRPEIPAEFRVCGTRFIAALVEQDQPTAMVCVSLHDFIPGRVEDLHIVAEQPSVAVFYTIWSYKAGQGALLLRTLLPELQNKWPQVTTYVTLSPKTELARRFHLKNGAVVFRENDDTVNYHYSIASPKSSEVPEVQSA